MELTDPLNDTAYARLVGDQRSIYFDRRPDGTCDGVPCQPHLLFASRTDAFAAFGPATDVPFSTMMSFREAPTLTADGLTIVFAGAPDRYARYATAMYVATRATTSEPFSEGVPIASLPGFDEAPYLVPDGSALYFDHSGLGPNPGPHLHRSKRVNGAYVEPTLVDGIVTDPSVQDRAPVVTPDERVLHFGRLDASGAYQVWVAKRETTAAPFGPPQRVPELSTFAFQLPTWISADECEIYLMGTPTWSTPPAIFRARRPN
ncbi:MAG TPA: hypothetical protein VFJ20_00695 [Gemmatimonadaceae bacterium]|nr:hypothetical protein [Gemmatimonadaceae bacterium]